MFELIKKSEHEYKIDFGDSIYASQLNGSVYKTTQDFQVVIIYDTHWIHELRFHKLSNVKKYFKDRGQYYLDEAKRIWDDISYYKIKLCNQIRETDWVGINYYGRYYDEEDKKEEE